MLQAPVHPNDGGSERAICTWCEGRVGRRAAPLAWDQGRAACAVMDTGTPSVADCGVEILVLKNCFSI